MHLPDGGEHDLLMTSYPVSHARTAAQFVQLAVIGAGPPEQIRARLLEALGPAEAARVADNLQQANRVSESLALESYWSRGAVLWGPAGPVRFRLSPLDVVPLDEPIAADEPRRLELDFAARLRQAPVFFRLSVQKFVDEERTPIEDGAVEWKEQDAPMIPVATLTIGVQDLLGPDGRAVRDHVDSLAFNPWFAPPGFRPLGNLNRARRTVYPASAREWQN